MSAKTSQNRSNGGFSLLEISIVILIAAAITAVILSAKDIHRNAELQSVITDINRWTMVTNSFVDIYNGLPGDITDAEDYWPGETENGNGDGGIQYQNNIDNEDLRAWDQLVLAGLIEGNYTGELEPGNLLVAGTNIPPGPIKNSGYRIARPNYDVYGKRLNGFIFGLSGKQFISGAMFTSHEAWSMDNKMDDGLASFGRVVAINGWSEYGTISKIDNPQENGCVDNTFDVAGAAYTMQDWLKICTVQFWLDPQLAG